MNEATRTLVHSYYTTCCTADPDAILLHLSPDLVFRSPQDQLYSAQVFAEICIPYMRGLSRVEFLKELYDDNQAFVVLGWVADNGMVFHSAEYLRIDKGRIAEIMTINNEPGFWAQLHA